MKVHRMAALATLASMSLSLSLLWAGCGDDDGACSLECGGECVDPLTDPQHCGECGNVCPVGTTCQQGTCQCPGIQRLCDGECTATDSDRLNCGQCGVICGYESDCAGGQCGRVLEPYGTLHLDYDTPFIWDATRMMSDADYFSAHESEGLQTEAFAAGSYGTGGETVAIPDPAGGPMLAYTAKHGGGGGPGPYLEVVQQVYTDDSYTDREGPQVRITFPGDDPGTGALPVEFPGYGEIGGVLVEVTEQVASNSQCTRAVGSLSELTVTNAVDTTATDGGELAFEATEIILYHPTDTPWGDLSSDLLSQGKLACSLP